MDSERGRTGTPTMGIPVTKIVDALNHLGLSATYHGANPIEITRLRPVDSSGPGDLTFVMSPPESRRTEKLVAQLATRSPSCVITNALLPQLSAPQIVTRHPLAAIAAIAEVFFPKPKPAPGIHPLAAVSASASLGDGVSVGPFAVVGDNVSIGDNSVIHPHVVLYSGVQIGRECVIHAGAVIREAVILGDDCLIQPGVVLGGDGFGYFPDPKVGHRRIPHIGTLILGNRVDLGANSTIDRATLGETRVGDATKIDNLVQIGHNVQIGERSILCGQVGLSGSCVIGNDVTLGGQVGVANQVSVADKARVGAKAGVAGTISQPGDYAGYPIVSAAMFRRISAAMANLPELFRRVKRLERVANLQNDQAEANTTEIRD